MTTTPPTPAAMGEKMELKALVYRGDGCNVYLFKDGDSEHLTDVVWGAMFHGDKEERQREQVEGIAQALTEDGHFDFEDGRFFIAELMGQDAQPADLAPQSGMGLDAVEALRLIRENVMYSKNHCGDRKIVRDEMEQCIKRIDALFASVNEKPFLPPVAVGG